MTLIVLILGMVFSTLLTWLILHKPSQEFIFSLIKIVLYHHPWLGIVITCLPLLVALISEHYLCAMVIEFGLIIGVMVDDFFRSIKFKAQMAFVIHVVSALKSYVMSGFDGMSACAKLQYSEKQCISAFGKAITQLYRGGLKNSRMIMLHPLWKKNREFKRFLKMYLSVVQRDGNLQVWLKRYEEECMKKIQFRKTLNVKTTQIKLQFYVLTVMSWFFLIVAFSIFPHALAAFQQHGFAQLIIVSGLGLQCIGIFVMKQTIQRSVGVLL